MRAADVTPAPLALRAAFDAFAEVNGRKKAYRSVFLRSPFWKAVRRAVLKRDRRRCQCCSTRTNLDVHHLSYARMWEGCLGDLLVVCRFCHIEVHRRRVRRNAVVRLWKRCALKHRPTESSRAYDDPAHTAVVQAEPTPSDLRRSRTRKKKPNHKRFAPGYSPTAPVRVYPAR